MSDAPNINGHPITVEHDNPGFDVAITMRDGEANGISYLDVVVTTPEAKRPNPIKLNWQYPAINVHQRTGTSHIFKAAGMGRPRTKCSAAQQAPVWSLFDYADNNRLSWAVSDAINTCELSTKHAEETAELTCCIEFFIDPLPPLTEYRMTVRFDQRDFKFWHALEGISDWWAAMPEYTPAPVPDAAREPVYSTWYSYHLDITPESIEKECKRAKELGMHSVIVDDGWQTEVKHRGYAYCGDWEPAPGKFPDMKAHVDAVHKIGMKYLLWYSVPFVGVHTKAYEKFKTKFLSGPGSIGDGREREWFTLDPRFPDVREYLINIYESAMRDYGLDGFKLDFVDCFATHEDTKDAFGDGRDIESVPDAADRLMSDIITRLRAIKPDVMIEFRQSYIGPAMRKYGNIFRVGDEPNNAAGNRVGSMLLRQLSGNTAIHSDMVMWHGDDSVESAAMQLIHALYTVPQVSVRLAEIPDDHVAMIRRYLQFWTEHRDVLLDGKVRPSQPQHTYPNVYSETDTKVAAAAYANGFIQLPEIGDRVLLLANGTFDDRVVIELHGSLGNRNVKIWSCTGEVVSDKVMQLGAGVRSLPVPPAGTAVIG